jgi:hypothetical protein
VRPVANSRLVTSHTHTAGQPTTHSNTHKKLPRSHKLFSTRRAHTVFAWFRRSCRRAEALSSFIIFVWKTFNVGIRVAFGHIYIGGVISCRGLAEVPTSLLLSIHRFGAGQLVRL